MPPENNPGQEPTTPPAGQEPAGGQTPQPGQPPAPAGNSNLVDVNAVGPDGKRLWFDAKAVAELRQEAASLRVRLEKLEKNGQEPPANPQREPAPAAHSGATDYQKQIQERDSQINRLTIQNAVIAEAAKAGIVDPMDAVRLADLANVKIEGSTVVGVAEAVKALAEAKPYLVQQPGAPKPPKPPLNPTNPAGQGQTEPAIVGRLRQMSTGQGLTFGDGGTGKVEE